MQCVASSLLYYQTHEAVLSCVQPTCLSLNWQLPAQLLYTKQQLV
jgi:hypothetical protein